MVDVKLISYWCQNNISYKLREIIVITCNAYAEITLTFFIFHLFIPFRMDADRRTPKSEELQKQKNSNDIRIPIFQILFENVYGIESRTPRPVELQRHKNSSNQYYWKFPPIQHHFPTVELLTYIPVNDLRLGEPYGYQSAYGLMKLIVTNRSTAWFLRP